MYGNPLTDVVSILQGITVRADQLLNVFSLAQVFFCLGVFSVIALRGVLRIYPSLAAFVGVLALGESVRVSILYYRAALGIPKTLAYRVLFLSEWATQLLELSLLVLIIYGLFSEAMRPFPGLQRVGKIIFRWVGAVSLMVSLALSAGPELFAKNLTIYAIYAEVAPRFQQGISVLILCLLIFICFAIRPLGLTFRSHIFGVAAGLGVFSTVQLVEAAWMAVTGGLNLYSPVYAFGTAGTCVALLVWGIYFAMPQPKRRMILLPTTSPFFLWNRISEILGDAPGSVAVAGFTPDMLAPAEVEMLTLAIAEEEASAQERELALIGGRPLTLRHSVGLPSPSEREFMLSR